jgi:hypothetical protein
MNPTAFGDLHIVLPGKPYGHLHDYRGKLFVSDRGLRFGA